MGWESQTGHGSARVCAVWSSDRSIHRPRAYGITRDSQWINGCWIACGVAAFVARRDKRRLAGRPSRWPSSSGTYVDVYVRAFRPAGESSYNKSTSVGYSVSYSKFLSSWKRERESDRREALATHAAGLVFFPACVWLCTSFVSSQSNGTT